MILKGQKNKIEVVVNVEAETDRGKKVRDKLIVVVQPLSVSERIKVLETVSDVKGPDFIRQYLVEWREFNDSDGNAIPFSAENLDQVLEVGPYYDAILDGVKEGLFGSKLNQRLKN